MDEYFWKDAHRRSFCCRMLMDGNFVVGCSWTVILVRTLIDGHFRKDALGLLFLEGCSRMVIFSRTLMAGHFSENAHRRSF